MTRKTDLKRLERRLGQLSAMLGELRRDLRASQPSKHDGDNSNAVADRLAAYLALAPGVKEDSILHQLLHCAMHVVRAGGAGLTLLDPVKKRLVFRAAIGDGAEGIIGQEIPLKGSRHGLAFATGEVQSATPVYTDIEKTAGAAFRNVLVAPLLACGEAIGTISAVNKQDRDHFSSQDISAFKLFADLAAEVVRQRSREDILRRGFGRANRAKNRSLPDLSGEDMELLQLFEGLAALKQTHPALLPAVSQFVKSMGGLPR